MAERAQARLTRLLSLVSYLSESGPVPVAALAAHFGVSPKQIESDINTLWVSGTPGYLADDLIDFDYDSYENGRIQLIQSRGLDQPLRLGAREAMVLIAALNALAEMVTHISEVTLVSSLIAKLSAHLGHSESVLDIKLPGLAQASALKDIQGAIARSVALEISYVNASDQRRTRVIEPYSVVNNEDQLYVSAFCQLAGQDRIFRLDRIVATTMRPDIAITHTPLVVHGVVPAQTDTLVTLTLAKGSAWLAEQLPHTDLVRAKNGRLTLTLSVADPNWLRTVLLQHAPHIVKVEPQDWARPAAEQARAALSRYSELDLPAHDQERGTP